MRRAWLTALALSLAGGALAIAPAMAQVVVVQRNVNLRPTPSAAQPPIRLLRPPDELELLDPAKTNNYYHVRRAESGLEGWVWANNVRLDTTVAVSGQITAIDPSWPKPAPVVGTFRSLVAGPALAAVTGGAAALECGPVGQGGDTATNRLKNRTDVPATYRAVTFAAIGDLGYPATRRLAWPAESVAVVRRYEGVPVQVTGYLVAIKPQTRGSGESTNCYWTRAAEVDWHVALVEQPGDGEAEAIVVETTPRIRVNHPKWTVTRLRPWVDSGDPVRISGWLLFDPAHRNHLGRYRRTLWEVHPITKIEVWLNGAWVDADELP